MKIRNYSHACFGITTDSGTRLITDPWLYSPIYGNMLWQFPQATVPLDEFTAQDAIYISHDHPDHFCENTLAHFDRAIPIYIRRYAEFVPIRAILRGMGFTTIIELDDKQTVQLDATSQITLLADPMNTDSALIVRDGKRTILNQNDCKLNEPYWAWVGQNFELDLSIQCYGATHLFPAAYDMPLEAKRSAHAKRIQYYLDAAVRTAELIRSPRVMPAANDIAYFTRPDLDPYYVALAVEMAEYARSVDAPFEVLVLSPGDTYAFDAPVVNPYFKNRAHFFALLEERRTAPEIVAAAAQLEAWERSFRFDPARFERLFDAYVREAGERTMTVQEPDETLEIGLSVSGPLGTREYRLTYGPERKSFAPADVPLAQDSGLFMIVSVDDHLLEMAMAGAYFFEDLMNCRWRVKRFGSYGPSEVSFWNFLTAFTAYLLDTGEQPAQGQRGRLRFLPGRRRETAAAGL